MRLSILVVASAAALLGAATPLLAQPYSYLPKRLTSGDMRLLTEEGGKLLPGGKQTGTWRNPKTGNSGTVALLKRTEKNGMPCQLYEYTFKTGTSGDNTPYKLNWCKGPNGWKIAN